MNGRLLDGPADSGWIQLLRYSVVGGTAFALDFSLLWALTRWGQVHYLLSAALAFTAGLTLNYALSVRWVFPHRSLRSRIAEFASFALIGVAGLCLNEAIIWCATAALGLHYLLSKTISAAVVFLWNFTARKYMLFHGKTR